MYTVREIRDRPVNTGKYKKKNPLNGYFFLQKSYEYQSLTQVKFNTKNYGLVYSAALNMVNILVIQKLH